MDGSIQQHNQRAATVWSSGGDAYNEISRQISGALQHCVDRLQPKPGERVLDLATGTGWTSRLLARCGAKVIGGDIASELLADARRRAQTEHLDIEYGLADAEKLTFPDRAFDIVSSTFGVMFVSRPEAAAAEIARVCRKGGRIGLTTWLPDGGVFKMFQLMRPFMPPPSTPAPPSPFEWGRVERIKELFGRDFELKFEKGVATYHGASGAAAWQAFVTGYGPTKALAASLEATKCADLQRQFIAFHDGYKTDLGIALPREYLLTIGISR